MNKEEATRVLETVTRELRSEAYETLVARYLRNPDSRTVIADTGVQYQVEVQAFWDNLKPGNLRVIIAIDDSGLRAFIRPLSTDFIVAPDGTFVGE